MARWPTRRRRSSDHILFGAGRPWFPKSPHACTPCRCAHLRACEQSRAHTLGRRSCTCVCFTALYPHVHTRTSICYVALLVFFFEAQNEQKGVVYIFLLCCARAGGGGIAPLFGITLYHTRDERERARTHARYTTMKTAKARGVSSIVQRVATRLCGGQDLYRPPVFSFFGESSLLRTSPGIFPGF